jgi:hypothetical protein
MKKLMLFGGLFLLQFGVYAATLISNPIVPTTTRATIPPASADERAKTHFKMNFSDVQDAVWHVNAEDNIYCSFRRGEAIERVFYDGNGYWRYTVIGYPAALLDTEIRSQILNEYGGYKITYVNEIRSDYSEPVYMINIENSENIKVLRCTRSEVGEYQSLTKR